ncbi:MAG: DUF4422 domain-containing protein [Lachnospiraceae bacterium]|nr:DUF4422 domain-containing protein [Lachnospiraceae bacterium]
MYERAFFCIYGAGVVATSIYTAIKTLYRKQPLFFLVSDADEGKKDENPVKIDGIPVLRVSMWQEDRKTALQQGNIAAINQGKYLVAVPEEHHSKIRNTLYSAGIHKEDIVLVTNEIENRIMEEYYRTIQHVRFQKTVQELLSSIPDDGKQLDRLVEEKIQVFQAKCHLDKRLESNIPTPEYVVPIQVGTIFADKKIAEIQDNMGDNISAKNRNYCELTATYYAWKHSNAAYKGLCHYRRIFAITDEQMKVLLQKETEWNVILPYPSIHYPNISSQHMRYINDGDWQAMLQALQEIAPEYRVAYEQAVLAGEQFFYNYNMLIAKAEVFDDYCKFLFRVLARTEELTIPRGWNRTDRFAGYMGENLTTIYFLKNRDRLKIMYAGKLWIT